MNKKSPKIELVRILGTDSYRFILVGEYFDQIAITADFVLYDKNMPSGYKSVDIIRERLAEFRKGLGKEVALTRATTELILNLERSL